MSTILLVDDHHAFRTVFGEVLRGAGHTVLEAGTLPEGEHLAERHHGAIDILITEAVLSTGNGLEIFNRLRPSHPRMRVLFISSEDAENLRNEGLVPGSAPFLQKPFAAEDLIGKVQELEHTTPLPRRGAAKRGLKSAG